MALIGFFLVWIPTDVYLLKMYDFAENQQLVRQLETILNKKELGKMWNI